MKIDTLDYFKCFFNVSLKFYVNYFHVPYVNGSMVMVKNIEFEIRADSDCTTLKT